MSHSGSTENYNLPLFVKNDRPAWLTDFNGAMKAIDAELEALNTLGVGNALPKTGGSMSGNIDMDDHSIIDVAEVELPNSGAGLYIGSVIQPEGTTGARLTGTTDGGAAVVEADKQAVYATLAVGAPTSGEHAVNKNSLNGTLASYVKKSGGTMTGALVLSGDPTENLQAATKQYVDNATGGGFTEAEADLRYLQLSGGTMTGNLILNGSPTGDLQAATKAYVDAQITAAIGDAIAASY